MSIRHHYWTLLSLLLFASACKKEVADPPAMPAFISLVFNHGAVSRIDYAYKIIDVTIPDYVPRNALAAIFQLSPGTVAIVNGQIQQSSRTILDFTRPVAYTLSNSNGQTAEWTVRLSSNNSLIGLEGRLEADKRLLYSNEFYIGQDTSGALSAINGGPAVLAMALRWCHKSAYPAVTASDVRREVGHNARMSTAEICRFLSGKQVPWKLVPLNSIQLGQCPLTESIDKGFLALMCIDFSRIGHNPIEQQHTERFWDMGDLKLDSYSHFIAIKGYKVVSGELYFETYDPFSKGSRYLYNGEIRGRNRYYRAASVMAAANTAGGWKYVIVVGEKSKVMTTVLKGELSSHSASTLLREGIAVQGF